MQPIDPQYVSEAIAALQSLKREPSREAVQAQVERIHQAAKRRRRSALQEVAMLPVRVKGL